MFKKIFLGAALVVSFNTIPLFAFADHNTAHTIQRLQQQIQDILNQIESLREQQQPATSVSTNLIAAKFFRDDNVVTTSSLRVRNSSSTSGTILAVIPEGTRGVITGGPVFANGYKWWQVNWLTGEDGWSVENYLEYLEKIVEPQQPQEPPQQPVSTFQQPASTQTTQSYLATTTVVVVQPVSRPTITVERPLATERVEAGRLYTVRWSSTNMPSDAKIGVTVLKVGDYSSYATLVETNTPNDGSETVTMPSITGDYVIFLNCISATTQCYNDESGTFSVVAVGTIGTQISPQTSPSSPLIPRVDIKVASTGSSDYTDGPITITSSNSVGLSWTLSNILPSSCLWSGGAVGTVSVVTGTRTAGPFTSQQIITLSCSVAGISYSDSVNVNVATQTTTTTTTTTTTSGGTTTTSSAQQATITFSPENGTLVAGKDAWTYTLSNPQSIYNVLSVKSWKNTGSGDVLQGTFEICKVFSTNCTKSSIPTTGDIGKWKGEVLLSTCPSCEAVSTGKTVNFEVVAPPPAPPSPPAWISGVGFSFNPNYGQIIADSGSWGLNIYGLQAGDSVYVEAWKNNGNSLGKFKICDVSISSCSGSGSPTEFDIGSWEESLIVRRAGTDYVIKERGAIKFSVVSPPETATVSSASVTCSLSFSSTNIRVGDNISWSVSSNPQGLRAYWYGTKKGTTDLYGAYAGLTDFTESYVYQAGDIGTYTRYLILKDSSGNNVCTTNTVSITVSAATSQNQLQNNGLASVISAMMETLNSISKQLDLLK